LDFHSRDSIAVLTFAQGAGYPRLTRALLAERDELLRAIRREGLFRGVAIASNEESFAIGADLEEIATLDGIAARRFARLKAGATGAVAAVCDRRMPQTL